MAVAAAGDRSLKKTPTWDVAVVCAVFVIISILIEQGIHSHGKWFQKPQMKAMTEALAKIKADRSLKETPTWDVAVVCAVFGIISILIEQGIHSHGKWFQKRQMKAMTEAQAKIKAVFVGPLNLTDDSPKTLPNLEDQRIELQQKIILHIHCSE